MEKPSSLHEDDILAISLKSNPNYKIISQIGGGNTTTLFLNKGKGDLVKCGHACLENALWVFLEIDHSGQKHVSGLCLAHLTDHIRMVLDKICYPKKLTDFT